MKAASIAARRVFRSVDKADQVAVVEITKAVYFIDRRYGPAEPDHDLRRELKTEVHALGAKVKNQIARRCHGMAHAGLEFPKWVEFCRPRLTKEPVPGVGPDPHHAGEVSPDIAEADRTDQRREVAAKRPDCRSVRGARVDRDDHEDRGAGQILNHQLRHGRRVG